MLVPSVRVRPNHVGDEGLLTERLPNSMPVQISVQQRGETVLTDMTGWNGDIDVMADIEDQWYEIASRPDVTGSVTVFSDDVSLSSDVQDHIAEEWSDGATELGITRLAFVSEGITAMAASANIDTEAELDTFNETETAVDWAEQ